LRADARRNRARVLEVAEQVFASEGLAVPIDDIAKRAGVGIGTVYRHFPTKEALFAAIVQQKLARVVEHISSVAADPAPGEAFFAVLDRLVAQGTDKKDLVDALAVAGIDVRSSAQDTAKQLRSALGTLLKRAQAAGAVRRDVTVEEILALVGATLAAATRTGGSATRLFAIVRDGLRG
jgi:AcrR family transcriptional regulator